MRRELTSTPAASYRVVEGALPHWRRWMASSDRTLGAIKTDAREMFDAGRVVELCRASGYWPEADGKLDPATLVALFARQVAAGNVCCDQVRLMGGGAFSASGYCQA